jgi:nitroimidazol reductase NimA-like FMN-containing flavoprotein (pyridoxamine 5'-phosphate oxidase superfamily)
VLIQELSRQASLDVLARTRLGRLACAQGGQPYVVPIYFAYADHSLYGFATVGKKIEWMRVNPQVCVEVEEVMSPQQWTSVLAFGRYEELPDTPEWQSTRVFAHQLLKQSATWWEPAYVKTILGGTPRPLVPVFYRIHIVQVTGHRATLEPAVPPAGRRPTPASDEAGWLEKLRRKVRGERRGRR